MIEQTANNIPLTCYIKYNYKYNYVTILSYKLYQDYKKS